ncbi:zinc finger lsd1 subclass family protein (macronuclear) [Tetrahymena thermophila SB210]|uniref:Zinc finger lsd1 subclass family protein n=1 Tax=Tetrahymena thermophila (strain SB210) TaxID=312017 RepID=I7M0B2_TETTS|nr:zinc finger lsd1 subclass family protein [Tetrahymena thermophila SB210]EAR86107.2 zinc finger lsd1 subclass family protein [Tetrahymena thermophila SB210]|eukprot:XP_976702.2 zinc finger lsd1 subclass family protein [Tetrahymena thermophila SB210]
MQLFKSMQLIIKIAILLLFKGVYQVKGNDCSGIISDNSFDPSQIICALAYNLISDITQIDHNLNFPSSDCQNIKTIVPSNTYYGTGGDNCDYTKPIIFNYNSSPYYAQRVFLYPINWVFQSTISNCPTLNSSLSVNDLAPRFNTSSLSLYFSNITLCDYFKTNFIFPNLNQMVTKISFSPGLYVKYIEKLYILIFKCPLGCSSCDDNLINCHSCADGYYLSNNSCLKCDINCQTCINSSTFCQSCPASKYLYTNNSCIPCQNTGVFISGANCLDCDQNCFTCVNSPTFCLSCPAGTYLYRNNSCQSCQNIGVFISGANCLDCDQSCLTCNGSLPTNCLTCPSGKYLYKNNSCIPCQNTGVFISGTNCLDCDQSCFTCNGSLPTNCLTCPNGKYLHDDNSCKICKINDGFTIEGIYCKACFKGCKTCFGISKNQCSDCYDSYSLFKLQCDQQYFVYNSSFGDSSMQSINQSIGQTSQIAYASINNIQLSN